MASIRAGLLLSLSLILLGCDEDVDIQMNDWQGAGPILFISGNSGTGQLYSMNADGTGIRQITSDPSFPITYAAWSPIMDKIAFTSPVGGIDHYGDALYVVTIATGGLTNVTPSSAQGIEYRTGNKPVWSRDGKNIYFYRVMQPESAGNTDVFVVSADGKTEKRLTETPAITEIAGAVSSDERFVYLTYFDYQDPAGNGRIAKLDLMEDTLLMITPNTSDDSGPVLSRDDSLLTFSSAVSFAPYPGRARQLFTMKSDGSNRTKLTPNQYRYEDAVAWSAEGTNVLYNARNLSDTLGQEDPIAIYVIDYITHEKANISPFNYLVTTYRATSWR